MLDWSYLELMKWLLGGVTTTEISTLRTHGEYLSLVMIKTTSPGPFANTRISGSTVGSESSRLDVHNPGTNNGLAIL